MPEQKDLTGRRIVLTRAREQSADWRRQLEARGATVLELPLLQVSKDIDKQVLADCLTELGTYEWLLFTSANGVRFFFEEFHRLFDDIRSLGVLRIGVVGEATAAAVRAQHLRVELMPDKATGEALAKALLARESMDSAKVLVVTGNRNRDTLVSLLEEGRAIVDQLPVYRTEGATDLSSDPVAVDYRARGADAVFFASPSAAQAFHDQAAALKLGAKARPPLLGGIGPTTAAAMRELGLRVDFEAAEPSLDSLVAALLPRLK